MKIWTMRAARRYHCVVCGKRPVHADSFPLCATCDKGAPRLMAEPAVITWAARRVRANERRKYRELLRAAEDAAQILSGRCDVLHGYSVANRLIEAVRNAKARRSR